MLRASFESVLRVLVVAEMRRAELGTSAASSVHRHGLPFEEVKMRMQPPRQNSLESDEELPRLGKPIGLLYTWWIGDSLPDLPPLANFTTEATDNCDLLVELAQLDIEEVVTRMQTGHRPYVARLAGRSVAYGWSAASEASIGEVGIRFTIPPANRYLWDFATLPAWRGRGVYPRLLQAILAAEAGATERFWIGHDLENIASARGIVKAGFRQVGMLYALVSGGTQLVPVGPVEQARAGAALLGVPLLENKAAIEA
jgi:hypothetical protein